jgi:hypothetical protein
MALSLPPVKPGDVITAQMWNQVLSTINSLSARVAILEENNQQIGQLTIIDTNPKPVALGNQLTVFGTNFGLPGEATITVDGLQVPMSSISQATGSMLVFTLPSIQGVPSGSAGKQVTLTISHPQNGFAASTITVVRAAPTLPGGTLTLNMSQPPTADRIEAGQSYIYGFTITAISNMEETFNLTPQISQSGWQAIVVNADGGATPAQVTIPRGDPPQGSSVTVRIRITVPAGTAPDTRATLRLRATSQRNPTRFSGESADTAITVARPPAQSDPITVNFNRVMGGTTDANGVVVPAGETVGVIFRAIFPNAGTYVVRDPQIESNPNNLWSTALQGASRITMSGNPPFPPQDITISVTSQAGSQPTRVLLDVQHADNEAIFGQGQVNIHT